MRYIYYDPETRVVTVAPDRREGLGVLVGECQFSPGLNPNFIIHNLLANAGYRQVSGTTIKYVAGPANKD